MQRWCRPDNVHEGRLDAKHDPRNKLAELERQRVIKIANEPEYADLPPSKIVQKLADRGIYVASESTFYRVLQRWHYPRHLRATGFHGSAYRPGAEAPS